MKINQLKAGVILSYVLLFLNNVIGLLYTPIMLRIMGQSEYGLYSLTASIIAYLTVLDFGFGNAIIRYTAKYRALNKKNEEYTLNGMFLILYSFIGLLSAAIGSILYFNVDSLFSATMSTVEIERAKIMMLLLVFNLSVSFPLGIFGSIITAYENFVFIKLVNIVRSVLNPCLMIPLLFLGYKAIGLVVVTTILNVLSLLINMWYCFARLKIKFIFKNFDYSLLKEIFGYSFFVFLGLIVDKINWSTGQFILGAVSGTIMVAIYAVAMQFVSYYISFSTAIAGVVFPRITAMIATNAKDEEMSNLFIRTGRIQYIIMAFILSGFLLFGEAFIRFWAGEGYDSAFYMTAIILIPLTIPMIQNVGISILQAKNRQGFRSVTYVLVAVANIAISIPLGKMYGGIGCAIGTSISLIVGNIIAINIYYYKKIHIDIPKFWKEVFLMTIPVAIAFGFGIGVNYFLSSTSIALLVLKIGLFTIIYLLSMWFLGMNKNEQTLFREPVNWVFKRLKLAR